VALQGLFYTEPFASLQHCVTKRERNRARVSPRVGASWRRAARASLESGRPGRVCPPSPGSPGHTLPVGLLGRRFLSWARHLPSHSEKAAPVLPTAHSFSAAVTAQSPASPSQQRRPWQVLSLLCISPSPLMGLVPSQITPRD